VKWTPDKLSDLSGKTYFITGGNSGIGLEAARILCGKGAAVVIGARSLDRARQAISQLQDDQPGATIRAVQLDLTDPASIAAAAEEVIASCPQLDALINNAGVMQTPERRTAEGFELQLATNHLGHFRLSAQLYPHLVRSKGRIVVVSSVAHRFGKMNFDDLMLTKNYDSTVAYAQSKLANLLFTFELDRRLRAANSPVACMACHPGYSATNLQSAGVGMEGGSGFFRSVYAVTNRIIAQPAERGAYPTVLAAAEPTAEGGAYYGPTWFAETRGPVGRAKVAKQAQDTESARRLWEETERLVGPFPLDA
jgi:NAD(P)-dependent dehydrogenase (short-subunit alcohol dehydrogenase family)